jgi:hypothetical protein
MGIGSPRELYERVRVMAAAVQRFHQSDADVQRSRAVFRFTPLPGHAMPRWYCVAESVKAERYPTNWGLPRAVVTQSACAARGDPACVIEVRWKNPPLGRRFWGPTLAGAAVSAAVAVAVGTGYPLPWPAEIALGPMPVLLGAAVGYGLVERARRDHARRMLDLQSEEILYSNNELDKKFRDLETKIEQLSLLSELSAAVNATLDVEKIYEQALHRLVHRMGYQGAYLYLVDGERRMVHGHRMAGGAGGSARFEDLVFPLDDPRAATARVARAGLPLVVEDVEASDATVDTVAARSFGVRSVVLMPLRVAESVFGVLNVTSSEAGRVGDADSSWSARSRITSRWRSTGPGVSR